MTRTKVLSALTRLLHNSRTYVQRANNRTPSGIKFNVEGLQRNQRLDEMSPSALLEWVTTEQGKYKMAVYAGWGGTFALMLGKCYFLKELDFQFQVCRQLGLQYSVYRGPS